MSVEKLNWVAPSSPLLDEPLESGTSSHDGLVGQDCRLPPLPRRIQVLAPRESGRVVLESRVEAVDLEPVAVGVESVAVITDDVEGTGGDEESSPESHGMAADLERPACKCQFVPDLPFRVCEGCRRLVEHNASHGA